MWGDNFGRKHITPEVGEKALETAILEGSTRGRLIGRKDVKAATLGGNTWGSPYSEDAHHTRSWGNKWKPPSWKEARGAQ